MSILSFPFESKETLDLCELQLAQELLVAYMWKKNTNLKGAVNGCGWNMNLLISFLLICVCYLKRFQIVPPAVSTYLQLVNFYISPASKVRKCWAPFLGRFPGHVEG